MTTNLGAKDNERRGIGTSGQNSDGIDFAITQHFTPEFRNRIDAVVKFSELDDAAIDLIIDKLMNGINSRIVERGVEVRVDHHAFSCSLLRLPEGLLSCFHSSKDICLHFGASFFSAFFLGWAVPFLAPGVFFSLGIVRQSNLPG